MLTAVLLTSAAATPTRAAPVAAAPKDKGEVLAAWTQTSTASYGRWLLARENRGAWKAYGFDWATDGCTGGPDQPFGYDFRLACYRHDFGYRNYGEAGTFRKHKKRLDLAFRADLGRVCDQRPFCLVLAGTYYTAAVTFGHA